MALQVLNIASKFSPSLQIRVISIPWMKRTTTMLSLKARAYNTDSGPVRYVPKKSSPKGIEPENSSPLKGFNKRVLDNKPGGIDRTLSLGKTAQHQELMHVESSFLDDEHQVKQCDQMVVAFSKSEEVTNHYSGALDPALMEEAMDDAEEMEIQEESDTFKQNMQVSGAMQDARELAVKLLATRAFTAVELRKKLLGKSFPPDIVEDVITNCLRRYWVHIDMCLFFSLRNSTFKILLAFPFHCRGSIDDSLYAETFSRSRFSSSSWGPRRIMQALSRRGVSGADTDKALKQVFKGGECGDHESNLSLSKHSMDHLLAQVSKQWLQYRGFSWDVISLC